MTINLVIAIASRSDKRGFEMSTWGKVPPWPNTGCLSRLGSQFCIKHFQTYKAHEPLNFNCGLSVNPTNGNILISYTQIVSASSVVDYKVISSHWRFNLTWRLPWVIWTPDTETPIRGGCARRRDRDNIYVPQSCVIEEGNFATVSIAHALGLLSNHSDRLTRELCMRRST